MMPSIASQLAAMTGCIAKPAAAPAATKNRPSRKMIELAYTFVGAEPITARDVQKLMGKEISTAQASLRILCEEESRIVLTKIAYRGQKQYVRA